MISPQQKRQKINSSDCDRRDTRQINDNRGPVSWSLLAFVGGWLACYADQYDDFDSPR